jgi:hypothetical protein
MIFKEKKQARWAYEVEQRKADIIHLAGGDEASVDSVMGVLFGTRAHDYEDNQYFVYGYDENETKQKWWQRLNALWIIPLVLILVFPVQWLVKGRVGIKENTKFGRTLINLVGKG